MSDEVNRKLDKLDSRLDRVDVTLARLTSSVEEHVRRTNLLEDEIKPIKAHVNLINAAAKITTALGGLLLFLKQFGLI